MTALPWNLREIPAVMTVDTNTPGRPGRPNRPVDVGELIIIIDYGDGPDVPFMAWARVTEILGDYCFAQECGATYGREWAYAEPVPPWTKP